MKIKNYEILCFQMSDNYNTNCYLIINLDLNKCFIVDPGSGCKLLIETIKNKGLQIDFIYITHGHFDHWAGMNELYQSFDDLLIYFPYNGDCWLKKENNPLDFVLKTYIKVYKNDVIKFHGLDLKVYFTPGHSIDSTIIYIKYLNVLLTGDTLFFRSVGRSDFIFSSPNDLKSSVEFLYKTFLIENPICLPGHGISTFIEDEYNENPFFSKKNLFIK